MHTYTGMGIVDYPVTISRAGLRQSSTVFTSELLWKKKKKRRGKKKEEGRKKSKTTTPSLLTLIHKALICQLRLMGWRRRRDKVWTRESQSVPLSPSSDGLPENARWPGRRTSDGAGSQGAAPHVMDRRPRAGDCRRDT